MLLNVLFFAGVLAVWCCLIKALITPWQQDEGWPDSDLQPLPLAAEDDGVPIYTPSKGGGRS